MPNSNVSTNSNKLTPKQEAHFNQSIPPQPNIVDHALIEDVHPNAVVKFDYKKDGTLKKVTISPSAIIQILINEGYRKIYSYKENKTKALLVRIENNIVEPVTIEVCQNVIAQKLWNYSPHTTEIRDEWQRQAKSIINDITLNSLNDFFIPQWVQDTKEEAFFYFKNKVVRVTPQGINSEEYSTITGYIWKSQITEHEFTKLGLSKFENHSFWSFLLDICSTREGIERTSTDSKRWEALLSVIGYYLHRYKDESRAIAVIFSEANLNMESQEGRTGKGLILKAISHLRNMVPINGSKFNFDDRFKWQDIELDTDIVMLDEATYKFSFRDMFSPIAESLRVEKKSKQSFIIPFQESPKFAITTNEVITNESGSAKDRRFDMELLPFYDSEFKPTEKYKTSFFSSHWDIEEWNQFYNSMIYCCYFYLAKGRKLLSYESDTMYERKLIMGTNEHFREWVDSEESNPYLLPQEDWRKKEDAYNAYYWFSYQDTPPTKEETKRGAKPRVWEKSFWSWVNTYCKLNKFHYEVGRHRLGDMVNGERKQIPAYHIYEK